MKKIISLALVSLMAMTSVSYAKHEKKHHEKKVEKHEEKAVEKSQSHSEIVPAAAPTAAKK